ncbi:MAG: hypothetical protein ABIF19_02320 [Planctomycetota bacterium]
MTEREKISNLSTLLADVEEQVIRCDRLNPWGGIETQGAFLEICSAGAALIAGLYNKIDGDIIEGFKRSQGLSKLKFEDKSALEASDVKQRADVWGRVLEKVGALKGAKKFCISLAENTAKWSKGEDFRAKFRASSQQVAGNLLYDLLDYLAEYDPEEYSSLRLQVLCSYLKELRVEFLWNAHARGPCRTDTLPEQCRFEKLPENLKGQLVALHGDDQHKFIFQRDGAEESECLINNTGLENYRSILAGIWDQATGKLPAHPKDGSAAWTIKDRESILNLEAYASRISDLLRPLSAIPACSERTRAARAVIRDGRARWAKISHIDYSYLRDLDGCIADLEGQRESG